MPLRETTISGRTQIIRLLHHLQDLQCPLVLSLNQAECCRSSILAINSDDDYLLLDGVPLPQCKALPAPRQAVELRAQFHGEHARFSSHIIEAADLAGKALLRVKLPASIVYHQRRAHFRVQVDPGSEVRVTLVHEESGSCFGILEDISLGGIAVRLERSADGRKPEADLCLIQLPGGELFHSEIDITNIRPVSEETLRIGARFRDAEDVQQRGLERFIRRLEREFLKKRSE
ncbi:MAG: hypothetical protein Kow006_24490 [Gammaproteobacteria bacterium]